MLLVLLGRAGKFALAVYRPGVHEQLGRERLAVLLVRQHVRKVEGTPEVASAVVSARKGLHGNTGGAHALSGL